MRTTHHASGFGLVASRPVACSPHNRHHRRADGRLALYSKPLPDCPPAGSRRSPVAGHGLKREDLHEALTSAFFENPGSYLTRASRNRANLFLQGVRHD